MELVQYDEDDIKIDLIFPKKDHLEKSLKSSNDKCFYFVNSRPVLIRSLDRILKSVFDGKFPTCLIALNITNDDVDVNLEPNKSSVMFKKQDQILHFVECKLKENYKIEVIEDHVEQLEHEQIEMPMLIREVLHERHDFQNEPKLVKASGDVPKLSSWSKGQVHGVQPVAMLTKPKPSKKREIDDTLDASDEYFETMKKQMLMTSFTGTLEDFGITPKVAKPLVKKTRIGNVQFQLISCQFCTLDGALIFKVKYS